MQMLPQLTIVLSRSPQQESAFEKLLVEQQNPASPNYHRWLTPTEIGERFGLSQQDIASVTGWLQSEGLHVTWVSPSGIFIGFGGSAADIGRAFQTELHHYSVNGVQRFSVSSDPMVPTMLAPLIRAIRGLYTVDEPPLLRFTSLNSLSPELTVSGDHFLTPADFATIYDIPGGAQGTGETIGIVGESRTDSADFANFDTLTGADIAKPTEIVPTAYGGVDPGPAYTAPPAASVSVEDQGEARLDVIRAGSTAPGVNLLLVVATSASGGISVDAQYLVQTSPVPAQVMTISFGGCESAAGVSSVDYWDALFQQAASEGISAFVSSGDSGASGCDTSFATPPSSPSPNSPNAICSSSYATCVGGTEFNDAADPSQYWSSTNGPSLGSALSYIPEGGWNEPLNASSKPQVACSGGGVSAFIATPSWQTGTGVPTARSGRYTPDVAFSAADHDGYVACLAAGGGACINSGASIISRSSLAPQRRLRAWLV
jgi:subtilase family serine protease